MLTQILLTGLVVGRLYALAGVGLVVMYKTSEIINFAQGDTATLTTFVAFTLLVGAANVTDYKTALAKYFPKEELGIFSMNGWTHAAVFVRAVQAATSAGAAPTVERVLQALESLKDEKIGLAGGIGFSASEHNGVSKVTVLQAKDGKFQQVSPFMPLTRVEVD